MAISSPSIFQLFDDANLEPYNSDSQTSTDLPINNKNESRTNSRVGGSASSSRVGRHTEIVTPVPSRARSPWKFEVQLDDDKIKALIETNTGLSDQLRPNKVIRQFLLTNLTRVRWSSEVVDHDFVLSVLKVLLTQVLTPNLRELILDFGYSKRCFLKPTQSQIDQDYAFTSFVMTTITEVAKQLELLIVRGINLLSHCPSLKRLLTLSSLHTLGIQLWVSYTDDPSSEKNESLVGEDLELLRHFPSLTQLEFNRFTAKRLHHLTRPLESDSTFTDRDPPLSITWLNDSMQSQNNWEIHPDLLPFLSRLPNLTTIGQRAQLTRLQLIQPLTELKTLGISEYYVDEMNMDEVIFHASRLREFLLPFHQLHTLSLLVPTEIHPPEIRVSFLLEHFSSQLLHSILHQHRHHLTSLRLEWPHLTFFDLIQFFTMPSLQLKSFRLAWTLCTSCQLVHHRWFNAHFDEPEGSCLREEMLPDHEEIERRLMEYERSESEAASKMIELLSSNSPLATPLSTPISSSFSLCLSSLTEVLLQNESITDDEFGRLLHLFRSVRYLTIDLPRLTHLRAFAQIGITPNLEYLKIQCRTLPPSFHFRSCSKAVDPNEMNETHRSLEKEIERLQLWQRELAHSHSNPNDIIPQAPRVVSNTSQTDLINSYWPPWKPRPASMYWSYYFPSSLITSFFNSYSQSMILLAPLHLLPSIRRVVTFNQVQNIPIIKSERKEN